MILWKDTQPGKAGTKQALSEKLDAAQTAAKVAVEAAFTGGPRVLLPECNQFHA